MISKSIGMAIRLIIGIVFVGCLAYSFVLWTADEFMLAGLVLFIGLGIFIVGGILLWILQKMHKKGVYTYDAWEKQITEKDELKRDE